MTRFPPTPPVPTPTPTTPTVPQRDWPARAARPRRGLRIRTAAVAGLASLALLTLVGCAPGADVASSTEPAPTRAQLTEVDPSTVALPAPLAGQRVLDPGWATRAKQLDGVFLAPRETAAGPLEYLAVDAEGTALWTALRPATCSGFVLTTTTDGRAIAVLTDQAVSATRIADPVASAYDLRTGEHLWGPTAVTGPYKGPGLVFAAPPAGFMGDVGEKVALRADTGEVIARESALGGSRIVGEYRGNVITVDEHHLTALRPGAEGSLAPAWTIELGDTPWDHTRIGNTSRHHELGEQFLTIAADETASAIIDVHTGRVIADQVSGAALDAATGTLIALTPGAARGLTGRGEPAWEVPMAADARLAGAGSGLAFFRDGSRNRALDAASGTEAAGVFDDAPGESLVYLPTLSSAPGAAVVEHGTRRLFVSTAPGTDASAPGGR